MRLEAGTHLGSYEIRSFIGAGGMGEVYRAKDTKLGRDVAIKVLPDRFTSDPDALGRFEQEAKALATLSHPNILAVHDFGIEEGMAYVVLELLEGETLRERLGVTSLDWHSAVEIAAGVADGLAAAHARGIVHRDLKPDNIFLTRDGLAKILDFGLAGTVRRESRVQSPDDPTVTVESPGTRMGTPGYMSPEQVRGEHGDARSDIFSFGCVLHEMISGSRAFARDTAPETMTAILREPPPDVSQTITNLPQELARLIRRCLQKRPEDRFQSARDLAYTLRNVLTDSGRVDTFALPASPRGRFGWALGTAALLVVVAAVYFGQPSAPTAGPIDSLAVLPFVNASGDADADFLGEGIAESLINSMLTLPDLRVIPRNTAFRYKGREQELETVARELNVRAILTGRVTRRGESLIVSVTLEDMDQRRQIWGERYDRQVSDILSIEREITQKISDSLRLTVRAEDRARRDKSDTENPAARLAYDEGRFWWNKRSAEGFGRALESFDRAINLDPSYARAYAGRADTYVLMGSYTRPTLEVAPLAKQAAQRAIELDPTLADAYTSLGWIRAIFERDFGAGERAFQKAIELDPRHATAHHWHGYLLTWLGRLEEAERELLEARRLDPGSLIINTNLFLPAFFRRDFSAAEEGLRRALEMDPSFAYAHARLGHTYLGQRRFDEAILEYRKVIDLGGRLPLYAGDLAYAYGLAGRRAEALEELRILTDLAKSTYVSARAFGSVYAGLGKFDLAFEYFDNAVEEHDPQLGAFKFSPLVDPLRSDPRFEKLLERIGFPDDPPAPVVEPWPARPDGG